MKYLIAIILLLLSAESFSQTKYEHFDSIINNIMPKHTCVYRDHECKKEIQEAKERLARIGNPIYVYQISLLENLYKYQNEIEETCTNLNISIEEEGPYCVTDNISPMFYCYNKYLTDDLKKRRGVGIIDSIHVKAISLYLSRFPNKPIPLELTPNFKSSKYHKVPTCKNYNFRNRDTIFLPKGISYKEYEAKRNGKSVFLKKRFYAMAFINNEDSISEIEVYPMIKNYGDTTFNGHIRQIEGLVQQAFLKRYPNWTSGTFLGKKINEEVSHLFVLVQHNTKLD